MLEEMGGNYDPSKLAQS